MATVTADNGVVSLSGPLTFDTVSQHFRARQFTVGREQSPLVVDLGGVEELDSAGLAMLLEWQSIAGRHGGTLEIRNAPPRLLRLAALCEATGLLGLDPPSAPAGTTRRAHPE